MHSHNLLVTQRQGRARGWVWSKAVLEQILRSLLEPRLQSAVRVAVEIIARRLASKSHTFTFPQALRGAKSSFLLVPGQPANVLIRAYSIIIIAIN